MDKGFIIRVLGFALIPIILLGLTRLVMRQNEREKAAYPLREKTIIRPPQWLCWIAIIVMLFFTALLMIITFFPNGTESPFVFLVFSFFDLLGAYLLYVALVWRVEVFRNEDFFILRDYWGRRHKIYYSDCTSYQYRHRKQEIIIRNTVKNFTVTDLLVNCDVLLSALQQYKVKREKDR